jgi:hypothetical protein
LGPDEPSEFVSFARLSQELLTESSERTLQMVVDLAVDTVPGCDYAGVTMKHKGRLGPPAASAPLVNVLDGLQYELKQGPRSSPWPAGHRKRASNCANLLNGSRRSLLSIGGRPKQ